MFIRARDIDETTRAWVVEELSRQFKSTVELRSLHVRVLPMLSVKGRELIIHFHNRPDVPPMFQIKEFSFNLGLRSLFRAQHRISSVTLRNMVIAIPHQERKTAGEKPPASPSGPPPQGDRRPDRLR